MMGTVTVVLHWFLPTVGRQPRRCVPFGADGHRRPPTIDYLAQIARAADQLGFDGRAHADRHVVRGRVARDRGAAAARPSASSSSSRSGPARSRRRWPPRRRRPTSGISGGRLLLNIVTGGERQRAAPLRRLARPRRALRPHRRVPLRAARRAGGPSRSTSTAATTRSRGRPSTRPVAAAAAVLRRRVAGRRAGRRPPRRRLPDVGRAAGDGGAAPRADARARRRAGPHAALRHPPPRDHPRPCRRRVGRDRAVPRARSTPSVVAAAQARVRPQRSRSASSGWSRCTAARATTLVDRAEPVGRLRPGARRGRHGAGRQPRRGRRPHRGVPRARLRRVHPLRPPAPRGGLLVRRGRDARSCAAAACSTSGPAVRAKPTRCSAATR